MGSLLTEYAYPSICVQLRNFSSESILYHAISSFSNINAPARKKRHFMQFCRPPINTVAPLYMTAAVQLNVLYFLNF